MLSPVLWYFVTVVLLSIQDINKQCFSRHRFLPFLESFSADINKHCFSRHCFLPFLESFSAESFYSRCF